MNWEKYKKQKLEELEKYIKENKVDEPIIKLIKVINRNNNWVTTSSCSGRIVLLATEQGKKDAKFYKKWHRVVEAEEVELDLVHYDWKKTLWFRCEPFILHIATKDLESAKEFLDLVREKGIKRGGIQTITNKKVMIEIQGNGNIIFPVEMFEGKWNQVVKESNKIIENNFKKIKELEKILK